MTAVKTPSYRQRVGYQAGLLGGFSLLATALLVIGNQSTADHIAARYREDLLDSLSQVIAENLHNNNLLDDVLEITENGTVTQVYRGAKDFKVTALAWQVTGVGYAGDINLLMGVNQDGEILGVRTLAHTETPGLGDKIELARSDWILDFNGLSIANTSTQEWQVKKDGGRFDAFSGATITPRGVVAAIYNGLEFFRRHRDALISPMTLKKSNPEG